jgi:hypothetical protein
VRKTLFGLIRIFSLYLLNSTQLNEVLPSFHTISRQRSIYTYSSPTLRVNYSTSSYTSILKAISFTLFIKPPHQLSPQNTTSMSPTTTTVLRTTLRTLKPFHLPRTSSPRFASTSTSTSIAAKNPVYFGPAVYWGKAWKDVRGTFLLYVSFPSIVFFLVPCIILLVRFLLPFSISVPFPVFSPIAVSF